VALAAALRALPHWNGGARHVFFDMTDSRAASAVPGAERAYVWKSGFDAGRYRRGVDTAFPQFPLPGGLCTGNEAARAPRNRTLLASFKGTFWSHELGAPPLDVRAALRGLHNGRDVLVYARGDPASMGYRELLADSVFAFVPRGGGLHSYRYLEALSCGAVPVLLADDWVPPFSEVLDVAAFTIVVREADAASAVARLRAVAPRQLAALRAAGAHAYRTAYADPLATALRIHASRGCAAARDGGNSSSSSSSSSGGVV
jgi:hypothetical protein